MNRKPHTKKIKITSRGIVTTSRGRCRTPILSPYMENVNTIFSMLTRDKAKVIEILADGKEMELDIYNFSNDNNVKKVIETPKIPVHVGDPDILNAGKPTNEIKPERPLTRKERRELERKARAVEEATKVNATEVVEKTETVEETSEEVITKESAIVEEDAISE